MANDRVLAWHWTTGKELWSAELTSPVDLLLDEERQRCRVLLRDGTVLIFDLEGRLVRRCPAPEGAISARLIRGVPGSSACVVVAETMHLLDSAGRWTDLPRIGDAVERYGGFLHERVEWPVDCAVVGRNGRVVFVSSGSGRIEIQDLKTGERLWSLPPTKIGGDIVYAFHALYTTPDGRRLICLAKRDGWIGWVAWDLVDMKQVAGRRLAVPGRYFHSLRHPGDLGLFVQTRTGLHLLDWDGTVQWRSTDP